MVARGLQKEIFAHLIPQRSEERCEHMSAAAVLTITLVTVIRAA